MRLKPIIDQTSSIAGIVEFGLGDADCPDSFGQHDGIAPFVPQPANRIGMPKRPVRFEGDIAIRKEEVNAVASDLVFLNKRDSEVFERFSDQPFWSGLSKLGLNALARAKAAILTYRGFALVVTLAPFARLDNASLQCFALASVGAVKRVLGSHSFEQNPARPANVLTFSNPSLVIATARAVYSRLASVVAGRCELVATLGADLSNGTVARCLIADAAAKADDTPSPRLWLEQASAVFTSQFLKMRATFSVFAGHCEGFILPHLVGPTGGFICAN